MRVLIHHGLAVALLVGATAGEARAQRQQGAPRPAIAAARQCTVERVTDGDTFRCTDGTRVRLLLIDAPEMNQPPFGRESAARLRALLPAGAVVRLERDVEATDRYGRTLAYVYRDSALVNEAMVRAGYAVVLVYPPNVRHVERMRAAAAEAREAKRGLWAVDGFACDPRDRRRGRC